MTRTLFFKICNLGEKPNFCIFCLSCIDHVNGDFYFRSVGVFKIFVIFLFQILLDDHPSHEMRANIKLKI